MCEFWSNSPAEADPVLLAENERLKETAKIAIQEIGAWSRKAGKLEAENERLKEALQSLYDEQNGPPLIRYQKSWEAAMDKAEQALKGGK